MAIVNVEGANTFSGGSLGAPRESSVSAVSWAAVLAGAVAAVSLTFILVALGSGIGLASISPWPNRGVSATTFTFMTAIWLIVVQWASSAVGGYTTGRLRTRWAGLHTHEVFYRDTAHGFLTWASATVLGALLFAGAALHTANHGMQAAATASIGGGEHGERGPGPHGPREMAASYDLDRLFRSTSNEPVAPERYAEVTRIMSNGVTSGTLSADDSEYLAKLVAARSGIPPQEARKRVDDVLAEMKEADARARKIADQARSAAAEASIYMALSMLVGAFVACAAAALGGKRRDEHL